MQKGDILHIGLSKGGAHDCGWFAVITRVTKQCIYYAPVREVCEGDKYMPSEDRTPIGAARRAKVRHSEFGPYITTDHWCGSPWNGKPALKWQGSP